jgi:hypothetical protein
MGIKWTSKKITDWNAIFSIARNTCFLFAVAYLLSPSSVEAQCEQWEIASNWNAVFATVRTYEMLENLTQSGTEISGKARIQATYNPYQKGGKVTGHLQGDKVSISIEWRSPDVSAIFTETFEGTIGPDGNFGGQAYVTAIAGVVQVGWSSDTPMKCLYKPIHHLGVKPTTPTTVIVPMITASQTNLVIPSGQTGQTVLTWDGGKDHPYAEVWVKVDDGDETFVVEQGKGTRQVTVEPGKSYLYILTDASKRLATVTVKSQQ